MTEATKIMADRALVTPAMLTAMEDFTLGEALVSPARRIVSGPGGEINVEPRVMQVLVCLAETAGRVVSRETLFERCWGGVFVGDDSLNRAIAGVRRVAEDVAAGSFAIETVPRAGYRLTGATPETATAAEAETDETAAWLSRRTVAGGTIALALAGGAGWWAVRRPRTDARLEALMEAGAARIQNGTADDYDRAIAIFEQAVALRPDDAEAWGLLAYLKGASAEAAAPDAAADMANAAAAAAQKALAIDPKEPNALTALAVMRGSMMGWASFDRALRDVLAIAPRNALAMSILVTVLQAAGFNRESWEWNERVLAIEPLSPIHLYRKAFKHWIAGRVSAADRVIDRTRDLFPSHPGVWNAQFLIFAYTGRAEAALAMLDGNERMLGAPPAARLWRTSLAALDQRSAASIAKATRANLEAAKIAPGLAAHATMTLAALGEVDAAFAVADGFLLSRGTVMQQAPASSTRNWLTDRGWRMTQWLFTPPTAVMRADARFAALCDGTGLTEYWRRRGITPDYRLNRV